MIKEIFWIDIDSLEHTNSIAFTKSVLGNKENKIWLRVADFWQLSSMAIEHWWKVKGICHRKGGDMPLISPRISINMISLSFLFQISCDRPSPDGLRHDQRE
jgi:hypothetical protein